MTRKVPTRTCIACGKSDDKRTLVRIVRTPEGDVVLDKGGRMPGRGAYVCLDAACFEKVRSRKLLAQRLRCAVSAEASCRLDDDFRALLVRAAESTREGE